MKTINSSQRRYHAIAISLLTLFSGFSAADDTGKRIDNGRVDLQGVPPASEVQPSIDYPLPSGVTRAEVQEMRMAAHTVPVRVPDTHEVFDDAHNGVFFSSGSADLTDAAKEVLEAIADRLRGKRGLRLELIGHTDSQSLSAAARRHFRDNQALSEARALAVAAYLRNSLALNVNATAIAGRGDAEPVASNVSAAGMAHNRRVVLSAWYEAAAVEELIPSPTPATDACTSPTNATDLPFRITVDGEPMASGERTEEADRQRCTDVALARANIQIKYDDLAVRPALNVWLTSDVAVQGEAVDFRGYSNYQFWIGHAEVRLFRKGDKADAKPYAILPLVWDHASSWQVPIDGHDGGFGYVLRVYDHDGQFDETSLKSFDVVAHRRPLSDLDKPEREGLTGWGENSLNLRNIAVKGGTISVSGTDIKPGETIEVLGQNVPIDPAGRFALSQILPSGPHAVEVTLREPDGRTALFRRNLSIPDEDWFYVAIGDLTVGRNNVVGPAQLVTEDTQHYNGTTYVDGRGAFYLKGKIKGEWLLTAAADTQEQPLHSLFSNFSAKDPQYLLRNIDPNTYYPVYGDDSKTVDDAPTQGKFYVRLEKGDSHVLWGNFQTQWAGSELIQYSRGLYGADLRYRSDDATSFGEKRTIVDGFAADPGTLPARDEFNGTGGSLYYLHNQNVTQGSEHVWVEVRDKDSGLVIERKDLAPTQDYDIDYIQGRIVLHSPLSMMASGGGLVLTSALSGQPLYLVTTYEYVPGVTAISGLTTGVHASQWINDSVKVGVTSYHQGEPGADQSLKGAEVTWRITQGTSVKAEVAHSSGAGTGANVSTTGGFNFSNSVASGQSANAERVETTVDLADIVDGGHGQASAYFQNRQQGYSGPGQTGLNGEGVRQEGARATLAVGKNDEVMVKADIRNADSQDARNAEVMLKHRLDDEWSVSGGIRHDLRDTFIANASPTLSENGGRTDAIVRTDYQPLKPNGKPNEKDDWSAYGFAQGTVERTGDRDENNRAGLGGGWQINDRLRLTAEASDGNLGVGGRLGGDYRVSDRSNAYLNYSMETENPNYNYRGRAGSWVTGSDYRVSDGVRLFGENRITSGSGPQSLTDAFGVDLSPNDRWNYGAKFEAGTISDPLAGDLKRDALVFSVGYKEGQTKYSGSLEYRVESGTQTGERHVWLMRNTYGYQVDPSWRLLSKLNISQSSNSQGAFYDGDYHEFVLGAAYRPVNNDRWNTLVKYTNFYNQPTAVQVSLSGSAAEYSQRSQVFSVDSIYDVVPWLSVGFKYGLRVGELRDNLVGGDWYSSRADLFVFRADWHFVKEWDALAEIRDLREREAQDAKAGMLFALYRHVTKSVKLGAGYSFTRYSDDLTDLSFRSRGWFVNAVAKY